MIGASFAACAINVGARSEFNAAFAWLSARHITSLSIFSHRMSIGGSQCESAVFVRIGNAKLVSAVHWSATDDVSRYLVDGWIMVGAQCRAHVTYRQTARAFPLIPFERFHKWNVVSTGSHVAGESVRHFWMVRHFETTILLVGVQHDRLLVLPAMLTRVQRRHHAVSRIHAACLALTGCQAFSNV